MTQTSSDLRVYANTITGDTHSSMIRVPAKPQMTELAQAWCDALAQHLRAWQTVGSSHWGEFDASLHSGFGQADKSVSTITNELEKDVATMMQRIDDARQATKNLAQVEQAGGRAEYEELQNLWYVINHLEGLKHRAESYERAVAEKQAQKELRKAQRLAAKVAVA